MIIVDVWVPGAAKTKGSMVSRPNGSMRESVIGSSAWRTLMAQAVRDDIERRHRGAHGWSGGILGLPYAGPVCVVLDFYLSPGRSGWNWPIWERAGDVDKLARNVLDALGSTSKNAKMNGGAIVDDNLVCRLVAHKWVADEQHPPGARIYVCTMDHRA